jgi:hypothetical protein
MGMQVHQKIDVEYHTNEASEGDDIEVLGELQLTDTITLRFITYMKIN